MLRAKLILLVIIITTVVFTGCSSAGFANIDSTKAKSLMNQADYVLLDVRTVEEYEEISVPGSILIPLQELETRLDELDKDKKYLVLCRSGNRSVTASNILIANGFKHVSNITGGITQW